MTLNYVTIITPIIENQVGPLKVYLAQHADPEAQPRPGDLRCRPAFPFDKIECLHFCSFVVLDADPDPEEHIPAQLIFEATFDGPRDAFLTELISVAAMGMRDVYQHCVDYPQCGYTVLELMKAYLVAHDVGANTFFSGSPGRKVGQIQNESRLRAQMVEYLSAWRQSPRTMPATHAELRQQLQSDVILQQPNNDWARKLAAEPWEVRWRDWIIFAVGAALVVAAGLLGFIILSAIGVGPVELATKTSDWTGSALDWIGLPGTGTPILRGLIALSVAWYVVRFFELLLGTSMVDPRKEFLGRRLLLHLLFVGRWAILVFLITIATLAVLVASNPPGAPAPPAQVLSETAAAEIRQHKETLGKIDATVGKAVTADDLADTAPTWSASLLLAGLALAGLLLLRYANNTLTLSLEFKSELTPRRESLLRFARDVVRFGSVLLLLLFVFVLARHLPLGARQWLAEYAWLAQWGGGGGVLVLVGVLAFELVILLILRIVRALERRDEQGFKQAPQLNERKFVNPRARAREEGGINLHQNHLTSLTYVKGGVLRRWLLRSTLLLIHLLARFFFNEGKLGDIPTILSARWVIIDGGRRLIFLDNYSGGWESYLNEFIDLSAVRGLNAIWTNTFIKVRPQADDGAPVAAKAGNPTRYAFPATRYYLWNGAEDERPFKAYVRASQIETIAWYSAYHPLSITNINDNTRLRQSLFKPLASSELDAMFQQL